MISQDKPAAVSIVVQSDVAHVTKGWLQRMKAAAAPIPCPVCRHAPQLRKHVFTGTMALALIHLYHRRGGQAEEATIPVEVKTGDSLKKLLLWKFAAELKPGHYQLTARGLDAVLLRVKVERECIAAHGEPMWFSPADTAVWLNEVLNQRYSYDELMRVPA